MPLAGAGSESPGSNKNVVPCTVARGVATEKVADILGKFGPAV